MKSSLAPGIAVALISAAVLAYEILLMALFSLIQWHHFAFLVVSIALLGFGLSGSILALARTRLARYGSDFMASQALAFALAAPAAYAFAQRLSFNPEELIWDPGHWLRLGLVILLLTLPFLFAANLIGFALDTYRRRQARIYAADLVGAGSGALLLIGALALLPPASLLRAIGLLGCAAGLALWLARPDRSKLRLAALLAVVAALALYPARWSEPLVSPYKEMSQLLRVTSARVIAERHGPLGLVSVVDPGAVPWRHAPGLSLAARGEPPPQLALFTNAGAPSPITQFGGERDALAYLDPLTSALPYHVGAPARVLVLGAGGGADVLLALYHGAARIDAIELNPHIVELVAREFAEFSGGIYSHPRVALKVADARGFLERDGEAYDLIQVPPLDPSGAGGTGLQGLNENFVYTVEALARAFERLAPGGSIALTRWVALPPRDSLKLFATALAALDHAGIEAPERHLALIRGLQTSTLLVARDAFDDDAIARLRNFADARLFDLAYFPGMPRALANRYNQLDTPAFYDGTQALLGPARDEFLRAYKFELRPATDDRPFHFHFARLGTLPELLRLRDSGGGGLLETGYLTLLVALALSVILGLGLILAPLSALPRPARAAPGTLRMLPYFTAIGLGFLLLEITFLQKYVLLLQHPVVAAATVLASFLIGAGLGSAFAQRHAGHRRAHRVLCLAVAAILLLGIAYLLLFDSLLATLAATSPGTRLLLGVALIAPLAFCLGLPFPLGLAALDAGAPALVPWAWGINGCASVAGAILATLLAIHFGFDAVIAVALGCYALAAVTFPRAKDDRRRRPVVKTASE